MSATIVYDHAGGDFVCSDCGCKVAKIVEWHGERCTIRSQDHCVLCGARFPTETA